MNIQIYKVNDELLSSQRFEIHVDKEFYVGNLTYSGLKKWKKLIIEKNNYCLV